MIGLIAAVGLGFIGVQRPAASAADLIVAGARAQVGEGAIYTPGYFKIGYPNGDLPRDKGVCTDVVIRALRHAGLDLQKLIHQDMRKRFITYPRRERRPDSNIDHRRCPNQIWFLKKYGRTLTVKVGPTTVAQWKPGDIVYWKLDNGLDHTGVLTDRRNSKGEPWVIQT
jgi:hypothetical protein